MQMAWHKQGPQPTLLIPSPFPEPQSIQQHQENHTQLKAAGVGEDTGGSTKATGEDEGLPDCQGVNRSAASGTSHYEVYLQALSCPEEIRAFSGRCSDKRSCVGTILATPRQTNLSLIPAERLDNNIVCRQGNPKCGIPPGKMLCWT